MFVNVTLLLGDTVQFFINQHFNCFTVQKSCPGDKSQHRLDVHWVGHVKQVSRVQHFHHIRNEWKQIKNV